jgi:hypothetical protein
MSSGASRWLQDNTYNHALKEVFSVQEIDLCTSLQPIYLWHSRNLAKTAIPKISHLCRSKFFPWSSKYHNTCLRYLIERDFLVSVTVTNNRAMAFTVTASHRAYVTVFHVDLNLLCNVLKPLFGVKSSRFDVSNNKLVFAPSGSPPIF